MTPGRGRGARPVGTDHAEGMSLVDQEAGPVVDAERGDLGQRRPVALHRVDAVDGDQNAAGVGLLAPRPQAAAQAVGPVVPERPQLPVGQAGAVDQAGVGRRVDEDGVGPSTRDAMSPRLAA